MWVVQPFAENDVEENKTVPFALKSAEGLSCEPRVWGPVQVVDVVPNSTHLRSYQRVVTLWGVPTGKSNGYGPSRGAAGIKKIEGKMRSKDFLGKERTGLTERRESRGR